MTCYYPLIGLPHDVTTSVTYSTFTLNQATGDRCSPHRHALDLALYRKPEGGEPWELVDRLSPGAEEDMVARSQDYGLAAGDVLVGVPVARQATSEKRPERLPAPASKRMDRSPVAERCSLGFHWRGVSSSYQGEYPLRMAELQKGTMVSFDPLLHASVPGALTLLCLVNVSRHDDGSPQRLECFEAHTHRLLASVPYRRNACGLLELPHEGVHAGELAFRSGGTVGIPIFLTLSGTDAPPSMSVEHTHPPTEFFWDQDRLRGSRAVKGTWLGLKLS
jgi:hypothetical protein